MAGRIGSLVRSYRFLIGAFSAMMLILLLRSSSSSLDVSRISSPSITKPTGPEGFNSLPINSNPGYIDNEATQKGNPEVADAVKQQLDEKLPPTTGDAKKGDSPSIPKYSSGKCDKPHQYVVMIDAGSTGSRVHIYEFDVCTQPPILVEETFEMLKPGLSSYANDPEGGAKSLDPLLERALKVVPADRKGCTPVAVKATAGLRLLGDSKSEKILNAVREHLEKDYPFPVVKGDGVSIMSGNDEGVYAWITTNYLLGNIGSGNKLPTSAVFDLGGGSTQIVFEPSFSPNERMVEGEHKYELNFGGQNYDLYQFSHLGYGLMQGRNKINSLLLKNAIKSGEILESNTAAVHELTSPCLPPGMTAKEEKVKLDSGKEYTVNFNGPSEPAGAQCRFLADSILNKDAKCDVPPCSFNGIHQPSLVHTFKETNDLYIFSYFYDRTQPLGMPSSFTLRELADLARMVCNGEDVWKSVFSGIDGSIEKLTKEPQWCLDLSFQVSLLHTGYDIPLYRELRTAEKIANNELGWCLGASLPLLKADTWECKVEQTQ